jgi:A/G-specific adenine glycosylase
VSSLARRLLRWFDEHGRHDLPWQKPPEPYRIWVSEIMLQQTQVTTVVAYFERFIDRFPTLEVLAEADLDEVLALWSGLGYYARARNLHRAAREIAAERGGKLPRTLEGLMTLPGIGRSTAGAILALSGAGRHPILDGNVKRVLVRYHGISGWPGQASVERELWRHAERHTPRRRVAAYTQAIMDLGATLCTRSRPACGACPLVADCEAKRAGSQQDLPAPRPRRARFERRVRLLLIRDPATGRFLLRRRPPHGIWGGLFSVPELGDGESPALWCRRHLGAAIATERGLATLSHALTHGDLLLEPRLLELAGPPSVCMDGDDRLWYKSGDALPVGIAAPIKVLLNAAEAAGGPKRGPATRDGPPGAVVEGALHAANRSLRRPGH